MIALIKWWVFFQRQAFNAMCMLPEIKFNEKVKAQRLVGLMIIFAVDNNVTIRIIVSKAV